MPTTFRFIGKKIKCLDDLKNIVKDNPTFLEHKDYQKNSIYHISAKHGHIEIIKFLEDEHNWDIYETNCKGSNVSMFAAYYGYLNIIEHLHKNHNYDFTLKGTNNETILSYAKGNRKDYIVFYLEDINKKVEDLLGFRITISSIEDVLCL